MGGVRESLCASLLLFWSRPFLYIVERVTGPYGIFGYVRAQPLTLICVRAGDVGDACVFQIKAILPALRRFGVLLAGIFIGSFHGLVAQSKSAVGNCRGRKLDACRAHYAEVAQLAERVRTVRRIVRCRWFESSPRLQSKCNGLVRLNGPERSG